MNMPVRKCGCAALGVYPQRAPSARAHAEKGGWAGYDREDVTRMGVRIERKGDRGGFGPGRTWERVRFWRVVLGGRRRRGAPPPRRLRCGGKGPEGGRRRREGGSVHGGRGGSLAVLCPDSSSGASARCCACRPQHARLRREGAFCKLARVNVCVRRECGGRCARR